MTLLSKLLVSSALTLAFASLSSAAFADVRIDIKNESSEDCSVAFNARVDKTKWVTLGWFVYMAGEEAPVILKDAKEVHDVFIYHDCAMTHRKDAELKTGWVKTNLKFNDDRPMENAEGYQEVQFERLNNPSYTITVPQR